MLVFVLSQNMVPPGDVDDDLKDETAEECSKFGEVKQVLVHEVGHLPMPLLSSSLLLSLLLLLLLLLLVLLLLLFLLLLLLLLLLPHSCCCSWSWS